MIGVDIGGTNIKAGAVDVGPDGAGRRIVVERHIATPRATPSAFYDTIAALVSHVRAEAKTRGLIAPCVAVAHPGRFLPDGSLARGTTPNLGTTPGEFDGVRPAEELARRLGGPVYAENDAIAQMRFGLEALLRDATVRPHLLGQTVVYLGPGTGMGGGVARVGPGGEVTTLTDGHLFDLQVPCGDGTLTAEELFTGSAIARHIEQANRGLSIPIHPATAEQVGHVLSDPGAPAAQRQAAQQIADGQGEILAKLIQTIAAGRIVKVRLESLPDGRLVRHVDEPDRAWSAADQAAVRGVTRFLLGGSVGISRQLGGRIRERALMLLEASGCADVGIFQIPVASADAGLLGVVLRPT